ncbi:hypothetical protein KIL84_002722 [Mauremys mutica]|uniref:Uncharacterized protein n=1 Tax=Mauremys mutica TaxID=74926 RepID=A0A9D3WSK2_9SAUR|nr:hypothetical protein KIL84_002722 [Mauremys mutica]
MGCMHSGRRARAAEPDGAEGPSGTADNKLRPKCKQQLRIVDPTPEVHSTESLNIRVIWRRVSIFGSRRDSIRSTKSTTSATTLPGASDSGPESSPKEAEAAGEKPPA